MQNCLGIYIEGKIIKYAKISKDRDNIKIESFGTKIYEDITQTITQIVQETSSEKTPVAVNLTGEYYDYFDLFALLSEKDLRKSTEIEFEMLCREKNIKKEDMEKRYIFVLDQDQENRMKAINVSIEKNKLEDRKELFQGHGLSAIEPLPICISNLVKTGEVECEVIVNLEEITTLTFIRNGQIDTVKELDSTIFDALKEIAQRENSMSKAYEILKNTTLASQDMDRTQEGNEYIDIITPVLYKIVAELKEEMANYGKQVNKLYFTGTGVVINNIDMYFQDRMNDIECNIVRPSFIESQSLKVGIKDYIEVNSAIALALAGTRTANSNELNFADKKALPSTFDITGLSGGGKMPKIKSLKESSQDDLDAFERTTIRLLAICLVFIMGYTIIASTLFENMERQEQEATKKQTETTTAIQNMSKNKSSIDAFTAEYQTVISKLNNQSMANGEVIFREVEISNFLTKIASIMPQEVKLISIENTTGRHFVIQARAIKYQQLGYFKAILETKGGLENVTASTGIRTSSTIESTLSPKAGVEEEYIVVTIEGDLK